MTTRKREPRRRDTDENPKITLAVVQEQMAQFQSGQDRIIHILEGNGKPGLLDRVVELESSSHNRSGDLQTLLDRTNQIASSVQSLADSVRDHLKPENTQHMTLISFMMKSPREVAQWAGWVVAALYILVSSHVLDKLAHLILGMP